MYKRITALLLIAVLLILTISSVVSAQFTPDVFVLDQSVVDGTVKISRAVINEPGWIVIHADSGGNIGPPIGQAPLTAGINAQVMVDVDVDAVTDQLYAMLHVDAGEAGTYEFPDGPDIPLLVKDAIVSPSFGVMGLENTVVGTAIEADGFNTLVAAIQAAGLADTLRGDGPFTVFAPTDEAFAALPAGTVDSLLADPDALSAILLHHVVADTVLSGDLEDGMNLASMEGTPLMVTIDQDGVSINDASVIAPDIEAFNGIIHVIDKVLIPSSGDEEAMDGDGGDEEEAADGDGGDEDTSDEDTSDEGTSDEDTSDENTSDGTSEFGDIVETAIAAGEFETLIAAVEAADLVDTLKGEGPFTVLAPTDEAFAQLPEATLATLLNSPEALSNVLLYHVLPGTVLSTDLSDGLEAETSQGSTVTFGLTDAGATVNGVNVVVADILASNGVIHIIDKVILPPSAVVTPVEEDSEATEGDEAMEGDDGAAEDDGAMEGDDGATEDDGAMEDDSGTATNDIVSIAAGSEDFSTLTAAIDAAGLNVTLAGDGPFTVFAPTNAAFEKLPAGTLESLLADRNALIDILFYHSVSGNLLSSGISNGLSVSTLQGSDIEFSVAADGVKVNGASIVIADIAASNGVIHAIDMVLLPPVNIAPPPVPTAVPTPVSVAPTKPDRLPYTGTSFGSFGNTLPVVSLALLALVAIAFWERKKR